MISASFVAADEPSALYTLSGLGRGQRYVNQNAPRVRRPARGLALNGDVLGDAPKNDAEKLAPLRCAPQWHTKERPSQVDRRVIRGRAARKGYINKQSLNASSEVALLSENKKKKKN